MPAVTGNSLFNNQPDKTKSGYEKRPDLTADLLQTGIHRLVIKSYFILKYNLIEADSENSLVCTTSYN